MGYLIGSLKLSQALNLENQTQRAKLGLNYPKAFWLAQSDKNLIFAESQLIWPAWSNLN